MIVRILLALLVLCCALLFFLSGIMAIPAFVIPYLLEDYLPFWLTGGITAIGVYAVFIVGTAWILNAILGRGRPKNDD